MAQGLLHEGRRARDLPSGLLIPMPPLAVSPAPAARANPENEEEEDEGRSRAGGRFSSFSRRLPFPAERVSVGERQLILPDRRLTVREGLASALRRRSTVMLVGWCAEDRKSVVVKRVDDELT